MLDLIDDFFEDEINLDDPMLMIRFLDIFRRYADVYYEAIMRNDYSYLKNDGKSLSEQAIQDHIMDFDAELDYNDTVHGDEGSEDDE